MSNNGAMLSVITQNKHVMCPVFLVSRRNFIDPDSLKGKSNNQLVRWIKALLEQTCYTNAGTLAIPDYIFGTLLDSFLSD